MSEELSPSTILRRQARESTELAAGTQDLRRAWKKSTASPGSAKFAATVEQAREAMPTAGRDVRGRREATFRCGSAEQLAQYEHRPVAAAPSAAAKSVGWGTLREKNFASTNLLITRFLSSSAVRGQRLALEQRFGEHIAWLQRVSGLRLVWLPAGSYMVGRERRPVLLSRGVLLSQQLLRLSHWERLAAAAPAAAAAAVAAVVASIGASGRGDG